MNYLRPDLLDRLARSYALGTLTAPARRRFAKVLASSREARQRVDGWNEQFNALAVSVPPMQPSEGVWQAILRRTTPKVRAPMAHRWWQPALGLACGALITVALVRVEPRWLGIEPTSTVAVAPSYVGLLTNAEGEAAALVSSLRHGRTLNLKLLKPVTPPTGKVAYLWALPAGGRPAFLLGAVPTGAKGTLVLSDTSERLFAQVPRLAVSYETAPVATGAGPSEPFVLSGHCVKLW